MSTPTKRIAMPGSHAAIAQHMAKQVRGRVLDAPCGSGVLARELETLGFALSVCDIDPANVEVGDTIDLTLADLNRDRLAYEDASFDYVVCSNGLHRLYNASNAIAEFARVLKPGGMLLASVPNYSSMARRMKYLATGSLGQSIDTPAFDQGSADPAAHVRFPLTPHRLIHVLEQHGLTVAGAFVSGVGLLDLACLPLSVLTKAASYVTPGGRTSGSNRFGLLMGGSTIHLSARRS